MLRIFTKRNKTRSFFLNEIIQTSFIIEHILTQFPEKFNVPIFHSFKF